MTLSWNFSFQLLVTVGLFLPLCELYSPHGILSGQPSSLSNCSIRHSCLASLGTQQCSFNSDCLDSLFSVWKPGPITGLSSSVAHFPALLITNILPELFLCNSHPLCLFLSLGLAWFSLIVAGKKVGVEEYIPSLSRSLFMLDTWSHTGHRLSIRL